MKVYVVGAGAIGGVLGARMAQGGLDVTLVDNVREHVERMNAVGLRISGFRGEHVFPVKASHPDDLAGELHFVVLAVKAQHTREALAAVKERLADDGFVVSLQNGLVEEIIAEEVGIARTVGAFVHFGADYQEPGHILLANELPVFIGELDGSFSSRLREIAGAISLAMPVIQTSNIQGYLWAKMCYGSLAFAGALVDQPFGEVVGRSEFRDVFLAVAMETVQVATALGVTLETVGSFDPKAFLQGEPAGRAALEQLAASSKGGLKRYTGIQRDIMVRKRPTEVEHQPGAVARKGKEAGVATPYHDAVVSMIRQVEAGERPLGWNNLDELRQRGERMVTA